MNLYTNMARKFPIGTRVRYKGNKKTMLLMTVVDNEPTDRVGIVWCAFRSGVDGRVIEAPYSWQELIVVSTPARQIRR